MKCTLGFYKNKQDYHFTIYCDNKDSFLGLLQTVQDGNALVYQSYMKDEKKEEKTDSSDVPFSA